MKFNLLGKTLEISEGRMNYMRILSYYKGLANDAVTAFKTDYDNSFALTIFSSSYARKVMEKYSGSTLDGWVKKYVSETRKYLTTFGEYTLTDEIIWEQITDFGVSGLRQKFEDFIIDVADDEATDKDIVPKVKRKFESGYFGQALRTDIMALCDFVTNYLHTNKLAEIQFVYEKDATQAKAIYQNLCDLNLSIAEQEQLALSLIELDPRNKPYYEYIFCNLPQAKYEIAAIAKFMSIDLSSLIEKELISDFDLKSIACEEDALKMAAELQAAMQKYVVSSSSVKDELDDILHDFDVKARTYDGILYKTRESRSQAEKDDLALFELHGNVKSISKSDCRHFITEIESMPCADAVKNKHLKLLQKRISFIDKEFLENMITTIDVSNEAECNRIKEQISQYDASEKTKDSYVNRIDVGYLDSLIAAVGNSSEAECNLIKGQVSQYNAPQETKEPYFDCIDKRIYAIWDAEDFERFTEIFIQTQVSNLTQIENNCTLIRDTGRTETKELFIKAMCLLNDAEIDAASKYALSKDGGFFASVINKGKAGSYETLTLNGRVMHPALLNAIDATKAKKGSGVLSNLGFVKNKPKQQATQAQISGGAKFCTACGAKVNGASNFCTQCGNRLK